jgi:hypothetical protein
VGINMAYREAVTVTAVDMATGRNNGSGVSFGRVVI